MIRAASADRARGRSRGPAMRTRQQTASPDAQSQVSDAASETSEPPNSATHAGALTPRGSTSAVEQLVATSARQADAFAEAIRLLARTMESGPNAMAQLLTAQASAHAEALTLQAETARLRAEASRARAAERAEANRSKNCTSPRDGRDGKSPPSTPHGPR